jgi:hypothetical protein
MTVVKDFENMPTPDGDEGFPAWIVPARNNIQRELLRLQEMIGATGTPQPAHWEILGYLLGAGFSLWRAVFQARHQLETQENLEEGRVFLDKIIRDNAAMYLTELNSWSLGYYINNARFRLSDAFDRLPSAKNDPDLSSHVDDIQGALANLNQRTSWAEWEKCFHVLRLMINAVKCSPGT